MELGEGTIQDFVTDNELGDNETVTFQDYEDVGKSNALCGMIPSLRSLTNFQVFSVQGNFVPGTIPSSRISMPSSLKYLPNWMGSSTSLEHLVMEYNELTGSIGACTSLQRITFGSNVRYWRSHSIRDWSFGSLAICRQWGASRPRLDLAKLQDFS